MRRYLDFLDRLLDALSYQRRGSGDATISPSYGLAERYVRALARQPLDPPDEYQVQRRATSAPADQGHDLLTGLADRDTLLARIVQDVGLDTANTRRGRVGPRRRFAVLLVDLNQLKAVNDGFGVDVGDGLLVAVADRLREAAHRDGLVARLGGDEFGMVVPGVSEASEADLLARSITARLGQPYEIAGRTVVSTAAIGVALYPEHGVDPIELLRCADVALYQAKAGPVDVAIYKPPQRPRPSSETAAAVEQLATAIEDASVEQATTVVGHQAKAGPVTAHGEGAVRGTGTPTLASPQAPQANWPVAGHGTDDLNEVGLFGDLEPEVRQQVIAVAEPRTYRKGQLLFVENDPGESLIVLKRGAVAVFRTAPTGERAMLSVIRPPDVLGEVSLLDGSARSASAEAIEDCTVLALSRGAFMELVHSDPRILDAVMRSFGAQVRRLTEQNADHVLLDVPGRVAKTLVRLAGDSQAPMIIIELNQSQLAEMTGGSRQSVNQAIGSFADRGWLRSEGRRITVTNLTALRRRAGMADRSNDSTSSR